MSAPAIEIDLISDTATRPSLHMRQAMAQAEVGDEQRGEDPTVNALNERVADLLGKEAAMFLPSGTMCNQIAIATHCRPGDEIIAAEDSHILSSEGAGAAVFAGCFIRTIPCDRGVFANQDVEQAVRSGKVKAPRSRLLSIEQTNNRGGGSIWSIDEIRSVAETGHTHGLAVHMDGARLMNAAVASGVAARELASSCDSVWLDLSKGLGCPIGGVLAGSKSFIEEANVWKHRFGGAMRQAGIVAAAGLYALDHNIERLAEDHENARIFANCIAGIAGISLVPPETNLVFFDLAGTRLTASDLADALMRDGIRIGVESQSRLRAVTHLDVSAEEVREAAGKIVDVLSRS